MNTFSATKITMFLFINLIFICFTSAGSAHEFIIKPASANVEKGQKLHIEAQAAHVFMVSEEAEPVRDVQLTLLQQGVKHPVTLTEDAQNACLSANLTMPENSTALLIGHRKPQIWSDTTEDVQEGNRKELEANGMKVLSVGRYEKFAKTLLNSNAYDKNIFNHKLGQALEIILLDNPVTLKAGDEMHCQILLAGKPFATEVKATYDGYSAKQDEYYSTTQSNDKGEASIKIGKAGLWMLRVTNTEKLNGKDADGADKWVQRSTFVFEVK